MSADDPAWRSYVIGVRAAAESPAGPIGRFAGRCRLVIVGGGLLVLWAMTWLTQHSVVDPGTPPDSSNRTGPGSDPATWLLALAITLALVAALVRIGRTLSIVLSGVALATAAVGLLLIPPDRRFESTGASVIYEWSAAPVMVLIFCGLQIAVSSENRWVARRGPAGPPEWETTTPMSDDPAEQTAGRELDSEVRDALAASGAALSRAKHRSLVFGCGIALLVLLTATWEKDGWNTGRISYVTGFGLVTHDLLVAKVAVLVSIVVLAFLILFPGHGLTTVILAAIGLAMTLLMLLTLPDDVTPGGLVANRYEWLPAPYIALLVWATALITSWRARSASLGS